MLFSINKMAFNVVYKDAWDFNFIQLQIYLFSWSKEARQLNPRREKNQTSQWYSKSGSNEFPGIQPT
jgi:hypothetical protein